MFAAAKVQAVARLPAVCALRGLVLAALVSLANLRNRDFCCLGNPPPLSPPSPFLHPSRFRPAFRSWGSHTDTGALSPLLLWLPTGSFPPEPDSTAPLLPFRLSAAQLHISLRLHLLSIFQEFLTSRKRKEKKSEKERKKIRGVGRSCINKSTISFFFKEFETGLEKGRAQSTMLT